MTENPSRRRPAEGSGPAEGTRPAQDATSMQYAAIRAELLERRLEPGSILNESTLSARSGVSRTPVREALGRLEQDGLLERTPRGYRVRVATPEDVLEIYEVRIALETAAAVGAALRRSEYDLARLTHLHEQSTARDDASISGQLNDQFHQTLWLASHNRTLSTMLDQVVTKIRLFDRAPVSGAENLEATRDEHWAIIEALRTHDVVAAQASTNAHLTRTRDLRVAALAQFAV